MSAPEDDEPPGNPPPPGDPDAATPPAAGERAPEYPLRRSARTPAVGTSEAASRVPAYPFTTKHTSPTKLPSTPAAIDVPVPEPDPADVPLFEGDIPDIPPEAEPGAEAAAAIADQPSASDDTILASHDHTDRLSDAVGPVKGRKHRRKTTYDDARGPTGASRRAIAIVAIAIVLAVAIAVLAVLGRASSQHYFIVCTTDNISAERGRSFPPWGSTPLSGTEWKPIALPPNAECKPRETTDPAELEGWYLDQLVDRASTVLTAKNLLETIPGPGPGVKGGANPLDTAAEQLDQALRLSRAPERRDQRKQVERLLGDVQYWRASLRLRDAHAALLDAARQFETAATQRPRHVVDAAAWSAFLRRIVDELRAGPNGAPPPSPSSEPAGDHPSAPAGAAVPVEPPTEPRASPPADAAVMPTGGVLL